MGLEVNFTMTEADVPPTQTTTITSSFQKPDTNQKDAVGNSMIT